MNLLYTEADITDWENIPQKRTRETALESGCVLYFPALNFSLTAKEQRLLDPKIVTAKRKNVSYDQKRDTLSGVVQDSSIENLLHPVMRRFVSTTEQFVKTIFPAYAPYLITGRSSFRPVEIAGRPTPSYRKDDKRLHIDAFPTTPMHDKRILRLFCNVNPSGIPRMWRAGEPFAMVAKRFAPHLKPPIPGLGRLKQCLGIIRDKPSLYDHYMLALHHAMKKDTHYQQNVTQTALALAAGSTWLTFTDQVSHAVDSGQHVFEQTFYLPLSAQVTPQTAPQHILQTYFKRPLYTHHADE